MIVSAWSVDAECVVDRGCVDDCAEPWSAEVGPGPIAVARWGRIARFCMTLFFIMYPCAIPGSIPCEDIW